MPEVPAEHLWPHAPAAHRLATVANDAFCHPTAPWRVGPITLDGGMACSERIVDIDQSRGPDDLAHRRLGDDSCVAALYVWASRHRNGAAVADDAKRVTEKYAPARSWEMRPCVTEVLSS